MRKSTIYTKAGDDGKSSLMYGDRRRKDDDIFEALGDMDELSALIGVICEYLDTRNSDKHETLDFLKNIQSRLIDIGADLAGIKCFNSENLVFLEKVIDTLDSELPQLKNFILPGGGKASSYTHLARAVCRRFERHLVRITDSSGGPEFKEIVIYINRLSDYLFVLSRHLSIEGDVIYKSCPLSKTKD